MKKGVFVFYDASQTMKNPQTSGVLRKIEAQVDALNIKDQMECELLIIPRPQINRLSLLFVYLFCDQFREYYDRLKDYDFVYFRRFIPTNMGLIRLLQRIKTNTKCMILYEFPTFPYDKEHRSMVMRILLVIDKIFRNKLCRYVDHAVVVGEERNPFGINSVNMDNGIQCNLIKPSAGLVASKEYHIIAVANFQFYHGYDRIIRGMKKYYDDHLSPNVFLHLVGPETPERRKYVKLIKKYDLSKYVFIHGKLYGQDLDDLYDKVNMGVESLACYRKGLRTNSDLKGREYIARGLPVISSSQANGTSDACNPYALYVGNDGTDIDIREVIHFLDEMYDKKTAKEIVAAIRKYAEEKCDIHVTMKRVCEMIISGNN